MFQLMLSCFSQAFMSFKCSTVLVVCIFSIQPLICYIAFVTHKNVIKFKIKINTC